MFRLNMLWRHKERQKIGATAILKCRHDVEKKRKKRRITAETSIIVNDKHQQSSSAVAEKLQTTAIKVAGQNVDINQPRDLHETQD